MDDNAEHQQLSEADESSERETSGRGPRLREIPVRLILPNLVTVLAICAGLSGIRMAIEHDYHQAVMMLLIAAFLDGVDGRLARLLKASSKFGEQMDSLADIVNFGIAPALVTYIYVLQEAGTPGWIAVLLYAIAAALRLARFNVMADRKHKASWQGEYFVGVPAPAGAIIVMLPVYFGFLGLDSGRTVALIASIYTVLVGFLLISRLPVWSGKSFALNVRREFALPMILVAVLCVALLVSYTWHMMIAGSLLYIASLPLGARAWHSKYGTFVMESDAHHEDDGPSTTRRNRLDLDI
ncbi:CDP-diacylglycerol--serine O-phosphatidyltransferase [Martelella mediterranea]|uniref:CDP-diacylglycerol--serine O-phosphatidyltransferase n=1 Tax=Martelella mediterranea TaxID=293089 RepID=A0A4R3NHC3_9HYPH|nr:CDP-diacylglycerol--serine O-phosphatidyltransferase [Martelella mediterranea]TCT31449.1 CDP-diacylglycerol--serine O-phosphatidyltransferase [Martelella mediterranea]